MALSIRHLDESWPKLSVYNLNQDSNSNRRRLSEDKWAREEREMQMEIKTFFQAKDGSKSHQSGPKGMANLRISDEKRKLADKNPPLPPISVNCTNPTAVLPCPPENLPQLCDKYNSGNFEQCFQLCKPSFCCTHDSKSKNTSPSCQAEPNCQNWIPCYIVWWKLSSTVGPATFLRLRSTKYFPDFYNMGVKEITADINKEENAPFYENFFNHFTDDDGVADDLVYLYPPNWQAIYDGTKVNLEPPNP